MPANICIVIDRPRLSAAAEGKMLTGYDSSIIEGAAKRAGLMPDAYEVRALCDSPNLSHYDMLIPLDNGPLEAVTGKKSIWKWHLSPLDSIWGSRVVPSFHPDQIKKEWHLNLYFEMAVRRAAQHAKPGPWERKAARYLLDPSHDQTISVLEECARRADWLSIDIETGRNQVNTFGVAWSPSDAIAVKVLPGGMPPAAHYKIWDLIRQLCENDAPKVMQNGIYERLYLSRYGIQIRNFAHDTMCAQKFLYPELEKGLDNVGRIYTMEPYWKDDGRVESEEGKQKDWGNIRDWDRHLDYNCKDTSNTLIASRNQRQDLHARGLDALYDGYIRRLFDCTYEMCARGLPLNLAAQERLIAEYEAKSTELTKSLSKEINPRSFKQKIKLLQDQGLQIPQKRDKKNGGYKDSSDELTLKKMRLQYPDNTDIRALLQIAGIEKALSSYLRVRTFDDQRIRFMLDPHGTETGRMSCSNDAWSQGLNAQTLSDYVKGMIEWGVKPDGI